MTNELFARGEQLTVAAPAAGNNAAGDPLLYGFVPCVAGTAYTPPGSRTTTGNIQVKLIGVFALSVTAKSALSPATNLAIAVGDKIYYDGGTKDATTGITYGGTLDANSGGTLFGFAMAAITSGSTATIPVLLARI